MAPTGNLIRLAASLLLCCGVLGLASCTAYEFDRQHVVLRHTQEEDSLELLVVSLGLRAPRDSSSSIEKASRQVEEDGAGYPHVILLGWPWEFDLPEIQAELGETLQTAPREGEEAVDPVLAELAERCSTLLAGVEVLEAGPLVHGGRAGLYQRLRIADASDWVALANDVIAYWIRRTEASGGFGDWVLSWADSATKEEWLRWAGNREPWILLDDGALRLRAPVSPAASASLLRGVLEWSEGSDGAVGQLFAPLTGLQVSGGVGELVFGPAPDGTIPFLFDFDRAGGKRLEAPGGELPAPPRDVQRLLGD